MLAIVLASVAFAAPVPGRPHCWGDRYVIDLSRVTITFQRKGCDATARRRGLSVRYRR